MSDKNDSIWEDNTIRQIQYRGKVYCFYIDKSCRSCGICADIAPENFKMSDDETHYRVFNSPRTASEVRQCIKAVASCPANSIKDSL